MKETNSLSGERLTSCRSLVVSSLSAQLSRGRSDLLSRLRETGVRAGRVSPAPAAVQSAPGPCSLVWRLSDAPFSVFLWSPKCQVRSQKLHVVGKSVCTKKVHFIDIYCPASEYKVPADGDAWCGFIPFPVLALDRVRAFVLWGLGVGGWGSALFFFTFRALKL